ncbi:helix-turn-helix domain-containing protein [Anaerocolumna sp. AGMB13020]|uniref:helix-turn-helix domain-containing protein n=1 Tax=Anaerocolumna sp. AGMB13020 TaxID=3081750 RepID=UPI002952A5A1|nr:helix-turn-helix domain-containing protein [Anaerocolumna sp. AGMB13020]WOO37598.1 helix-turn-helix domain-containing protein [Anaerocolumna sp. AGMB13020]
MKDNFYTIYQVADQLGMSHKTIRSFISDGRLKASKVGKQWRITEAELQSFVHQGESTEDEPKESLNNISFELPSEGTENHIKVSAVLDIIQQDKEQFMRLSNTLLANMNGGGFKLRGCTLNVKYYEQDRSVKIFLWGSISFIQDMLETIKMLNETV